MAYDQEEFGMQAGLEDSLVDTHAVAAAFGICEEKARRMCRDGDIEAVKIGRVWRVRRSVIEKVMAGER